MARYDLARLVYTVLGLVDSVYSGDAQGVVCLLYTSDAADDLLTV